MPPAGGVALGDSGKFFLAFSAFFVVIKTARPHFLLAKMSAGGCKSRRVFLCIFNKASKLMSWHRIALKTQDHTTQERSEGFQKMVLWAPPSRRPASCGEGQRP
jgi:hypothetical protein